MRISAKFGMLRSDGSYHRGLDLAVPVGTPVRAPARAKVDAIWTEDEGGQCLRLAFPSKDGGWTGDTSTGDDSGLLMVFVHLDSTAVQEGDIVERGTVIAYSGNSGKATTGPHLHIAAELYVDTSMWPDLSSRRASDKAASDDARRWIDPAPLFGGEDALEGRGKPRGLPRTIRAIEKRGGRERPQSIVIRGDGNAISIGGTAVGINLRAALGLAPRGAGGEKGPPVGRIRSQGGFTGLPGLPPPPGFPGLPAGFPSVFDDGSGLMRTGLQLANRVTTDVRGGVQFLAREVFTPDNVSRGIELAGKAGAGAASLVGATAPIAAAVGPMTTGIPYAGPFIAGALEIYGAVGTVVAPIVGAGFGAGAAVENAGRQAGLTPTHVAMGIAERANPNFVGPPRPLSPFSAPPVFENVQTVK